MNQPFSMVNAVSTPDALLDAIRAAPGEDTPRLLLADYWDEYDAEQPSPRACEERLSVALRQVLARPEDDAPRLEYAEICERYGRAERCEFIRLQCELARILKAGTANPKRYADPMRGAYVTPPEFERLQELRRRERELFEGHAAAWVPVPDYHTLSVALLDASGRPVANVSYAQQNVKTTGDMRFYFGRGFASEWWGNATDWFAHGDEFRHAHPLQRVTLTSVPLIESLTVTDERITFQLSGRPVREWPCSLPGSIEINWETIVGMLAVEWPGIEFEVPPAPADLQWTGAAGDGDMANLANWDRGRLPMAGDIVLLNLPPGRSPLEDLLNYERELRDQVYRGLGIPPHLIRGGPGEGPDEGRFG